MKRAKISLKFLDAAHLADSSNRETNSSYLMVNYECVDPSHSINRISLSQQLKDAILYISTFSDQGRRALDPSKSAKRRNSRVSWGRISLASTLCWLLV